LSPALATPRGPQAKTDGPPPSPEQAQLFARQLKTTLDLIVKQYARPVSRPELVHAALKGLSKASGTALPATLLADLKKADADDDQVLQLIIQTRQRLGNPRPLREDRALTVGLRAALQSLDPYSLLIDDLVYSIPSNNFVDRVGLELAEHRVREPLRVQTVIPGGPAQVAGIRPGDLITHLEGRAVVNMPVQQAGAAWRLLTQADRGQSYQLTLQPRGATKPRKVTLKPREFKAETVFGVDRDRDNTWRYWLDRKEKIAYLRLGELKYNTAADLQQVLAGLHKEGLRGLLLDLRWCPGGLLDEAVDVAALFVGDRPIATIDYRDGRKVTCTRRQRRMGPGAATFADFPVVALVNGETRGGGELIAAALQDYQRGVIAGQRTVGKGSVQNALRSLRGDYHQPLANRAVRLSVGVFRRSNGKNLQRFASSKTGDDWGVRPDAALELAVSARLSAKLGEWWLLHSIRPGTSDAALPIDDPANDPQRAFAGKALLKIIAKKEKAVR
jgi:C-terminal peptidase prc